VAEKYGKPGLAATWLNTPIGEAEMWLHELDANGYEVRKVVTFLDGHSERAVAVRRRTTLPLGRVRFLR
jgi:hypothetical protein